MAGWHDTIDVMMSLSNWWKSDTGILYGDGFLESIEAAQPDMVRNKDNLKSGWLASVAANQIDMAEPFFVSQTVYDMVDHACDSFVAEPFMGSDLITTSGFVLLPQSFMTIDRAGKSINTRAFSWGPCSGSQLGLGTSAPAVGTYMCLYSDVNGEDDFAEDMRDMEIRNLFARTGGYSLWHVTPWWFGEPAPTIEDFADEATSYPGNMRLWKWIQTFFRLSMQQVVSAEYQITPRAFAKRAKRAGRDPGVLVMSLRRKHTPKFGADEGEGPDWQYQWITRGHWRNQWYPSLNEHRQIWIAPYVKGPEDKPLKQPDLRVFTFNR